MNNENALELQKILQDDAAKVIASVDLSELASRHIIITGASGLIGINFLMSLKEFSHGKEANFKPRVTAICHNAIPKYLSDILEDENIKIIRGDLTDEKFIESLDEADYIIHAAGYAQPGKFMSDKLKTIAINTVSTMALLNKLSPAGKFLFISTSEIYSGLSGEPFKESQTGTTNTLHARACYIESKRCGEVICHAYFEKGRSVKSARLSLAYGPGTRPGDTRVMNSFIEKALAGRIDMMDHGEAIRTYCYVSDAVEIMWRILLRGQEPIYNVGGYSHTTIADLANKIGNILGAEVIMPKEESAVSGAPTTVKLDLSKIAQEFGKHEKDFMDFDQGLAKTIAWQKLSAE